MDFILTGFRQEANVRQFAFQGIAPDKTRTVFTVGADLQMIRKYQIALQELPLLCRRLLEEHSNGDPSTDLTFTEEDMQLYAKHREDAKELAAQKKKIPRRPVGSAVAAEWKMPTRY
jgi:hypothetical protein